MPISQTRSFSSGVNLGSLASGLGGGGVGSRKINTKTLCDLIGSRYYPSNEEIQLGESELVKCFDENNVLLGEMELREAMIAAESAGKDIVLRNTKIVPPVVKIMNYKKELLKRLFKKLGKQVDEKDLKIKTLRMATTISFHDLETKKKQAKHLLKTHQILKFYMKVNIYDAENIQKGRVMLLNIAQDLKEDAKMTVTPEKEVKVPEAGETKPGSVDEITLAAEQKAKQAEFNEGKMDSIQDGDDYDSDLEDQSQYLFMELKSTATFKDIDIDAMLEHTTFDDFMKGLYSQSIAKSAAKGGQAQSFENILSQVFQPVEEGGDGEIKLKFDDEAQQKEQQEYEDKLNQEMENQAIMNIREQRKRRAKSVIFDGSERRVSAKEAAEGDEYEQDQGDVMDLTIRQEEEQQYSQFDEDLDLLDAYIEPWDVKNLRRRRELLAEIEHQKVGIKCKYIFKFARQESDPFRLWS